MADENESTIADATGPIEPGSPVKSPAEVPVSYTPELGQMAFGQPWQQHEVPEIMEAALGAIRDEWDRVYWNRNQRELESPFGNSGPQGNLKTDVFEVIAYDWGDNEQPYNFAWRDLRISWYKYMGRGMSANMAITPDMAAQCLTECLASVRALDTPDMAYAAPSPTIEE